MHYFLFLLFLFVGCGGSDSNSEKIVEPEIKENSWYKPNTNTSWQWQLTGKTSDTYIVNGFG